MGTWSCPDNKLVLSFIIKLLLGLYSNVGGTTTCIVLKAAPNEEKIYIYIKKKDVSKFAANQDILKSQNEMSLYRRVY